jgi:hypothetical protein
MLLGIFLSFRSCSRVREERYLVLVILVRNRNYWRSGCRRCLCSVQLSSESHLLTCLIAIQGALLVALFQALVGVMGEPNAEPTNVRLLMNSQGSNFTFINSLHLTCHFHTWSSSVHSFTACLLLFLLQSITVDVRVYMHCDACERSVRRTVKKIDGKQKTMRKNPTEFQVC